MDNTSRALTAAILDDIRTRLADAAFHAVGGVPTPEDMDGIYRRVASNHRCTPPDVKRWWEAAQSEPQEETQA